MTSAVRLYAKTTDVDNAFTTLPSDMCPLHVQPYDLTGAASCTTLWSDRCPLHVQLYGLTGALFMYNPMVLQVPQFNRSPHKQPSLSHWQSKLCSMCTPSSAVLPQQYAGSR